MRIMFLASAAALAFAAYTPAQAMPLASGASTSVASQVTDVRWRKHVRHSRHYMRSTRHNNLATGLPGTGPARDMSKTNGGRANDR
jgi:hypothetical protein